MHSHLTFLRILPLFACLAAVVGCRATAPTRPTAAAESLAVVDSFRLKSPAVAICPDRDGLVVLEGSGTRLLRFEPGLAASETIPLTTRLAAPRGAAADRFYYYVYDDRVLYRMSKEKLELSPWLANVRVSGLAPFSPGEMLVSDDERDVVWYKTLFGDSRRFIDVSALTDPGQLVALPGGFFCVLNGPGSMSWFNRAGIITRTLPLDKRPGLMTSTPEGVILHLFQESNRLLAFKDNTRTEYELPGISDPTSVAAFKDLVAVLERNDRILTFRLP